MCVLCWHARLSASCLRTFLLTCVASLYQLKICLKFNRDSDLSKFVLADFFKKMDPLIFFKVDRLIWPKGYDFLQPKWCLLNWAQVVLEEPYGRKMQKRNRVPIVPPRLIRGMWECCYKANAGASPFAYGWDKCFASYAECILFSNTVFSDWKWVTD
jgi:hypothetical protein